MKICLLSHAYPLFKGDWRANFIESLALAYMNLGHSVTVFVPDAVGARRSLEQGSGPTIVSYGYAPVKRWHLVGYGRSVKKDLHPNPFHGILALSMVLSGTVRFARLLRKEHFDLVHSHWAIPNSLIALFGRFLAASRVPVFTSFPGSDVTIITRLGPLGRGLARIIRRSDYLSCNSSDLKEDLVRAGIPAGRIHLTIYGVDDRSVRFDPDGRKMIRRGLGVGDGETLLLMVGRFVPKKGFSTAFRALKFIAAKHPAVRLAVIGSGGMENEYRDILKNDGTDARVRFVGEVEPGKLSAYYSACDIFLMPSERHPSDGLNVVVPEAMACGRPIVASRAGGNEIVVLDGENGYLHSAGNPEDLADKTLALMDNPALQEKMGRKSLELIKSSFNWPSIAGQYLGAFDKLTE